MMVPKKSLVLTGAALFALGAFTSAQSQTGKMFSRYTKPLRTVSMNLETGTVTRGPQVANQAVVTTTDLANLDLGGFIGVDTGGGFCEWIDSAQKGRTDHGNTPVPSDLVSNFIFAYCSARLDVNSGGTGGTMTWTFYPSHATGNNHPATSAAVGAFTLTGLPSNTAEGAVFAQIACFFINITFGNVPLPFADGQIGYSWTFEDLDTNGIFAATFPFLSCVSSCSGPGPDGQLMDDMVDQYCPAGVSGAAPLATFSFGTTIFGGYFTSINIDMREVDVDGTVAAVPDPPGLNMDILTTTPVIIGATWSATVTEDPLRTTGSPLGGIHFTLVQSASGGPLTIDLGAFLAAQGILPPGSDSPLSTLYFGGATLGTTVGNWATNSPGTISIPINTNFVCLSWTAQAVVFGDFPGDGDTEADPKFSTATTGIVGAQ